LGTDSDKNITKYKYNLENNIYACIEMTNQAYPDIMRMPIKRFTDFLKWKMKLEAEKKKAIEEQIGKGKK
jgi:hypothetical protein